HLPSRVDENHQAGTERLPLVSHLPGDGARFGSATAKAGRQQREDGQRSDLPGSSSFHQTRSFPKEIGKNQATRPRRHGRCGPDTSSAGTNTEAQWRVNRGLVCSTAFRRGDAPPEGGTTNNMSLAHALAEPYQSGPSRSPWAGVTAAHQVVPLIPAETNRT